MINYDSQHHLYDIHYISSTRTIYVGYYNVTRIDYYIDATTMLPCRKLTLKKNNNGKEIKVLLSERRVNGVVHYDNATAIVDGDKYPITHMIALESPQQPKRLKRATLSSSISDL